MVRQVRTKKRHCEKSPFKPIFKVKNKPTTSKIEKTFPEKTRRKEADELRGLFVCPKQSSRPRITLHKAHGLLWCGNLYIFLRC